MRKRRPKQPRPISVSRAAPFVDPGGGRQWPRPSSGAKLVNNLTVDDARHMLKCEGGELSPGQLVGRIASLAIGLGLLAWAIAQGNVTIWHLLIPMVGQYVTLLVALPLLYLVLRHPGLRKDGLGSLRLLGILALIAAVAVAVGAYRQDETWQRVLAQSASAAWRWVTEAHMQWPLVWSVVESLQSLRYRVANLYEHGPPFVGVSLGCAMRFVVVLLGLFLVPFIAESVSARPAWLPWIVWGVIALSEVLAIVMHWDIQQRLRKLDARRGAFNPDDELPLA